MAAPVKSKIKLANKKFKHEQRRKQKARREHLRSALAIETAGRRKNEKRRADRAYISSLEAEL